MFLSVFKLKFLMHHRLLERFELELNNKFYPGSLSATHLETVFFLNISFLIFSCSQDPRKISRGEDQPSNVFVYVFVVGGIYQCQEV